MKIFIPLDSQNILKEVSGMRWYTQYTRQKRFRGTHNKLYQCKFFEKSLKTITCKNKAKFSINFRIVKFNIRL